MIVSHLRARAHKVLQTNISTPTIKHCSLQACNLRNLDHCRYIKDLQAGRQRRNVNCCDYILKLKSVHKTGCKFQQFNSQYGESIALWHQGQDCYTLWRNLTCQSISVLTTSSQSQINTAQTQIQREKEITNNLMRFDNLPTSSGQNGEILFKQLSYKGYKLICGSKSII